MSDTNLFQNLQSFRRTETPIVIQSAATIPNPNFDPLLDPRPYLNNPLAGTKPMKFMIHPITANETNQAEAMIKATPPPIIVDMKHPGSVGTTPTVKGYDDQDPTYMKLRQEQIPLREAAICLFGCSALMETTPGDTVPEKAKKLVDEVPGAILEWLALEIGSLKIISAVGENEVASFLSATASPKPKSSQPSKAARRTRAKKRS